VYIHPTIFVLWPRPSLAMEHINIRIAAFGLCTSLNSWTPSLTLLDHYWAS